MLENLKVNNIKIKHNLYVKPEYLIHRFISGNKFRKLIYNMIDAKKRNYKTLVTFGGAYSNHIAASAYAGKTYGFKTIGIIRGEELEEKIASNPTLSFAKSCGMQFKFISRAVYKTKADEDFLNKLREEFGNFYHIPEGGTNALAVKGCQEILTTDDADFNYICCSVGTGGTISGLINSAKPNQNVLGFPALKGSFLKQDIRKFTAKDNWDLIEDYHFGGYGKVTEELITFINEFKKIYNVPLDPIYTGKMMYGIFNMLDKGYFPKDSKILVIHTGGLQGIEGMNLKLKQKGWSLIK